jgi:Fe-S cluster assembly protein SufD
VRTPFDAVLDASHAGYSTLRARGLARFRELGIPTTKHEEWRFTSVRDIAEGSYALPSRATISLSDIPEEALGDCRLVFVNGFFDESLSSISGLPTGVAIGALSAQGEVCVGVAAEIDEHPFAALNTAVFQDGAYVLVPKGTIVEQPIHVVHIVISPSPAIISPRNLFIVEENAQVSIIESYVAIGETPNLLNAVTECYVEQNGVLEHVKLQLGSEKATHITFQQWKQERASNARSTVFTLGGKLVRNDAQATLAGEGCEATLNGLYVGRENQHIDNHTKLDHQAPHCPSHEMYKGVLDDKASAVFNGKIYVHQIAQKTDSKQSNMNLLLSDDAVVNTKPQLEIFADDVRCTHGATIGRLDEDAMFYFRSRGIPKAEAQNLLIYAFASDVIERIRIPGLIEKLEGLLFERFAANK